MDARDRRRFQQRAYLVGAVVWAGLVGVGLRAAQLQIQQHAHLARLGRDQYLNTIKIPAARGHIYDRHGSPLAVSVDVPSVYAHPYEVPDPRAAAQALAPVLGMDRLTVYRRLISERYFVWLKRHLSPQLAARVQALGMAGIGVTYEPRRFYPHRELGAHVLGFAGLDGQGLEGIEKQWDQDLLGEPQVASAVRDARGNVVLTGRLDPQQRARGSDIYLSLDIQIQHAAQQALVKAVAQSKAKAATAIVLDVASSEILAMATVPTFNPNDAARVPAPRRRNRAVTDMFEPGSVLKPLIMAAALDAGAIQPTTILFCENGHFKVANHTISDTSPHGWMGLTGILARSSNIGMIKIGQLYGKQRLEKTLRQLGLGRKSGIELPGEARGLVRPSSMWSELDAATIAFGQGLAVNAVQLAAAYRVLAAQGVYQAPRLVRGFQRSHGKVAPAAPSKPQRVWQAATTQRVTHMLEAAATPGEGTGGLAAVPGYRVVGKTGTSQKADLLTGGYSRDRFVALFVGYLPAQAPQVVIVVAVDEPQTSHFGAVVSAPPFAEIGLATLQRLGIEATASVSPAPVARDPAPHQFWESLAAQAEALPHVDAVSSPPGPPGTVPSFMGMTLHEVIQRSVAWGLSDHLALEGTGRVVKQEPRVGRPRAEGQQIFLTLAP